jgi:uncharacterized phage protein (TIGR02218 family)
VTFEEKELSQFGGAPTEFFKFRMGATVWRFSSSDVSTYIDEPGGEAGASYDCAAITREAADYSQEDNSANVTVTVARDNAVAQLFLAYVPVLPVHLTIYARHRSDLDEEAIIVFVGRVLSCNFTGAEARLTCAWVTQTLQRRVPSIVASRRCAHVLFDAGCTLDQGDWNDAATLSSVDGVTIVSATFDARSDGWYLNGWVQINGGPGDGERRFVVGHLGDTLTLMNPFPAGVIAGATVKAFAGCQRTLAECADKFDNLVNHLGFDAIPKRNPYSGGSIV